MASLRRSAAIAARISVGGASRSAASVGTASKLGCFTPSSTLFSSSLLRRSVVGCLATSSLVELSLMPLHSAEAAARLKSLIAVNSSSWTWLSQGWTSPL